MLNVVMEASLWGWPEKVASIHSKMWWTFTVTQMLTLTVKPLWQVERQMLFYASNLWSSTCAQAHMHNLTYTPTTKKMSKGWLEKVILSECLPQFLLTNITDGFSQDRSSTENPEQGGWSLGSGDRRTGWSFSHVHLMTSVKTHRYLCAAPHMQC